MRLAMLVSDMHGKGGDLEYMNSWRRELGAVAFHTRFVFVDELLPDCFLPGENAAEGARHRDLVDPGNVERARRGLRALVVAEAPALLIGFSYGGYVAYGARQVLAAPARLICVSSTRLRDCLPIREPPTVHALFGEDDPHRPRPGSPEGAGPFFRPVVVGQHGHDLYRDVRACWPDVETILNLP